MVVNDVTIAERATYPKKQSMSSNHFCKKSDKTERPLFWIMLALSKVAKTTSVLHHKAAMMTCKHMVRSSVLVISRLKRSKTSCRMDGRT